MDKNRSFPSIKGTLYHFYHYLNDNCTCCSLKLTILTSSLRHPKIFVKEFSYFLMPCH